MHRKIHTLPTLRKLLSSTPVRIFCMAAAGVLAFLCLLIFRLARRIASLKAQLAEAETEKMRANLLRAISHDLRSPLTGIIGSSLTYLEHRESLTEREKDSLVRGIYDASSWMVNMTENLLAVTHIENHSPTIHTREESVEEVVAEALQKIEGRHPECSILVSVPENPVMIPMDAVLIEQVIVNLLENALLHSGTGVPIDFIVREHPRHVSFTVRDYGNGIPRQKLAHLFENGKCASPEIVRTGRGIGLIICKTILDAHRGAITGRNHPKGAEFTFTLPKRKEMQHESQNQHSPRRRR